MTASGDNGCALLIAAQICDASGVRRADASSLGLLRKAAAELSNRLAGLSALPGAVAADGVLSVVPSSPEAAVEIILAIAEATRPEHSTFSISLVPRDDTIRERSRDPLTGTPSRKLESALLGAHALDAAGPTTAARESR